MSHIRGFQMKGIARFALLLPLFLSLQYARCLKLDSPLAMAGQAKITPVPQISYGARWQVSDGYSTAILIKNSGAEKLDASVTLYSDDGRHLADANIEVAPRESTRASLAQLFPGIALVGEGGLSIQWPGSSESIAGQVLLTDSSGNEMSLPLQGGYRYDTENALAASWWLPDAGSEGSITLFNASEEEVIAVPTIMVNETAKAGPPVTLAAKASREIKLRTLLQAAGFEGAGMGSITLHYTGAAHALQPSLFIVNAHSAFALKEDFSAYHAELTQQQTTWQFPYVAMSLESGVDLRGGSVTAYALLSNETAKAMSPQVSAHIVVEGILKDVPLSVPELGPRETRLLDLSQLAQQSPAQVSRMALTVNHPGQPGDLAMSIFSLNTSRQVVGTSEGLILTAGRERLSYWDVSSGHSLLHQIESTTRGEGLSQATFYYQSQGTLGSYNLPTTLSVTGDAPRILILSQLIRGSIPDDNGQVVSRGVSSGIVVLSALGTESRPVWETRLPICMAACEDQASSNVLALQKPPNVAFKSVMQPLCSDPPPPNSVSVNSANLWSNAISVSVEGVGAGVLQLTLVSASGNYSFNYGSGAVGPGTYTASMTRTSIPARVYSSVQAKWLVTEGTQPTGSSAINWRVLGVIRHSQYNVPAESSCATPTSAAWIIVISGCKFTPITLRTAFSSQVYINGTGTSISHSILKFTAGTKNQCTYPKGSDDSNTFLQVASVTGSCNVGLGSTSVATYPAPSSGGTYRCGDNLSLLTSGNGDQAMKHPEDYCPSCNTGFNGTSGHMDNFSTSGVCSGAALGDYGNYWTADTYTTD